MMASLKSWTLVLLLFVFSVLLVTPITLIDNLKPIMNSIEHLFPANSGLSALLSSYFAPLMLFLFNSVIISFLCKLPHNKSLYEGAY